MKGAAVRWFVLGVAVCSSTAVIAIDQTSHPKMRGAEGCMTVDALGTGAGVVQAGVQLSHLGGPTAAPPSFTFVLPNGQTAPAVARQLSSGPHDLSGKQSDRYSLTAIVRDPAAPAPRQLFVHYDSPDFLSEGGDLRIKLPATPAPCNAGELQ